MFDTIHHMPLIGPGSPIAHPAACAAEASLYAFLAEHAAALRSAGYLLGGACGLRLADAVVSDAALGDAPTRSARQRRARLLALLRLKNVHVPGSTEAAQFAMLDPADPTVEKICLLADRLADALDAVDEERASGHAALHPSDAGRRAAA